MDIYFLSSYIFLNAGKENIVIIWGGYLLVLLINRDFFCFKNICVE